MEKYIKKAFEDYNQLKEDVRGADLPLGYFFHRYDGWNYDETDKYFDLNYGCLTLTITEKNGKVKVSPTGIEVFDEKGNPVYYFDNIETEMKKHKVNISGRRLLLISPLFLKNTHKKIEIANMRRGVQLHAPLVAACEMLFAFSTMISWSYYGLQSWKFIFGKTKTLLVHDVIGHPID